MLAELACEPPAEAVRDLVGGTTIAARMVWAPPLYTAPLFWAGAGVLGLGAGACVLGRTRARAAEAHVPGAAGATADAATSTPAQVVTDAREGAEAAPGSSASATVQYGAIAPILRQQGALLAEAVRRRKVDPALLSAVEWSLDRHHARAVRLIQAGLGDGEDLAREIRAMTREAAGDAVAASHVARLTRILRAVAGEVVQGQLSAAATAKAPTLHDPVHPQVQFVLKSGTPAAARHGHGAGPDSGRVRPAHVAPGHSGDVASPAGGER